ncbi:MAG: winged helix-turn-helix transcriptional regulator [Anaerolineales bacterium]|nr:winged helix-turn-helix transcriptional regulator [Anaerolineales bacterium]
MKSKKLSWEIGTGYDLFASLYVLHNPAKFGLRASWAAGVRSRLPSKERETLERAQSVIRIPLHWLHSLQSEKNSISVLWAMEQILPAKRLEILGLSPMIKNDFRDILVGVAERGSWDKDDQAEIRGVARKYKISLRPKVFRTMLDLWSEPEEFGEDYLKALTTYHQVFFMEEERHIWSALEQAMERAKGLSQKMNLEDLIETLSQGVHFAEIAEIDELVMVPSYWLSPLVMFEKITQEKGIFLFGARSENVSLIPGDVIPPKLLLVLKTLSDPTRLRILRYMAHEQITPAELARRLRLRAPTVTHHLNALRLAGLVYLSLDEQHERQYQARLETINSVFNILNEFLGNKTTNE